MGFDPAPLGSTGGCEGHFVPRRDQNPALGKDQEYAGTALAPTEGGIGGKLELRGESVVVM